MTGSQNLVGRVVAETETWIGTPYRHQGSRKGVGCDCVGLIRGVWRGVYERELRDPGTYAPDWAEAGGEERLLLEARQIFVERPLSLMEPGDLILFRWRPHLPAKHAGILLTGEQFVHAYRGCGVHVSALVPQWRRRLTGAFAFPDIQN